MTEYLKNTRFYGSGVFNYRCGASHLCAFYGFYSWGQRFLHLYALSNCGCDSVFLITKLTLNLTLSHPHDALPDPKRVKSLLRSPNFSHINHQTCRPTLKTCHVLMTCCWDFGAIENRCYKLGLRLVTFAFFDFRRHCSENGD